MPVLLYSKGEIVNPENVDRDELAALLERTRPQATVFLGPEMGVEAFAVGLYFLLVVATGRSLIAVGASFAVVVAISISRRQFTIGKIDDEYLLVRKTRWRGESNVVQRGTDVALLEAPSGPLAFSRRVRVGDATYRVTPKDADLVAQFVPRAGV